MVKIYNNELTKWRILGTRRWGSSFLRNLFTRAMKDWVFSIKREIIWWPFNVIHTELPHSLRIKKRGWCYICFCHHKHRWPTSDNLCNCLSDHTRTIPFLSSQGSLWSSHSYHIVKTQERASPIGTNVKLESEPYDFNNDLKRASRTLWVEPK